MIHRRIFMITMWLIVAFAIVLFIFTQLMSISGVESLSSNETLIYDLLIAFLALSFILVIFQAIYIFLTRQFYGQFNYLMRTNFFNKIFVAVAILAFLLVIALNSGNRTTYTVLTWVSFGLVAYLAYLDIKIIVKFYYAY